MIDITLVYKESRLKTLDSYIIKSTSLKERDQIRILG